MQQFIPEAPRLSSRAALLLRRATGEADKSPIDEQGRWLATVIKGYFAYFAVPTNTYLLSAFRYHISMK